jgi:flavin-dependent dehydrogenase
VETDVLIIGAGPAGSVASAMLAKAGHRVLVLEAGTFPRFQIGESLLPRCNDILTEAGLFDVVKDRRYMVKNAAFFTRNEESERICFAEVFPGQSTQTFQVPRADFDQTLATAARTFGADIRFNVRVDAVEVGDKGAVVQATDLENNGPLSVHSQFVLDCSGYGRVLPKLLKLEKASVLSSRMALFNWFEGDDRPSGDREGDIWICTHPEGAWEWIIPFSNGRTSVGLVMERSLYESVQGCDRDRLITLLNRDENVRQRLRNATPVLKTMKLEGWSAGVERLYGPRWALTGNAAEFLDPIFSSGVTLALESASRAARAIHHTLRGEGIDWETGFDVPVKKAVSVFKAFVQSWYAGDLQKLILRSQKTPAIKRAITAILGGYVLDQQNPFVRDPTGTLSASLKLG